MSDEHVTAQYGLSYVNESGIPVQYSPADLELAPNDFQVINFKKLRDQRLPDRNGTILPATLTRGSALVVSSVAGALAVTDPTVNRRTGGVRLCQLYCNSEFYYAEDGSTVPCFLLLKYTPITYMAGQRNFTLINNQPTSSGFRCTFNMCPHPSPICRSGTYSQTRSDFCPPGMTGYLTYTETNLWIFRVRFCFVNGASDLFSRPC